MNWKECAEIREALNPGARFEWPPTFLNGFDCTQDFTVSDVLGAISWLWTWPGDYILSSEPFRTFFEIEQPVAIGAIGSTLLGWFLYLGFWIIVLMMND